MDQVGGAEPAISRCWLGTVALGGWGGADHRAGVAVIHAALDAGITVVDTADSYGDGEAESIVGAATYDRRDSVLLSTKFGFSAKTSTNVHGTGTEIRSQLEDSLRRLRTDYVDIYFIHRVAPSMDPQDLLGTLDDLVTSGKVRKIGTSMATPVTLEQMSALTRERSWAPINVEQPPYSIFVREIERSVVPTCRRLGTSLVGFAPLNGGWLTGKYRRLTAPPPGSRAATWPIRRERFDFSRPEIAHKLDLVERLDHIAAETGRSLSQLALAFALSNPDVTGTIVGPRTLRQLEDLVSPPPVPLERPVLDRIDALVPPGTTVDPHDLHGYAGSSG